VGSYEIQVIMYKFISYSCMAAAVAYAAPSPSAEAGYGSYGSYGGTIGGYGGYAAPVSHGPVAHVGPAPVAVARPAVKVTTHEATITRPKCTITYEEIETQNCVPKTEKECDTKEVEQETVTYEKECKEVTSKDCKPGHVVKHGIIKREAEADSWGAGIYGHSVSGYGGAYRGYSTGYATPVAHAVKAAPAIKVTPVAKASGYTTIKSDCREVTKEVCVNTPKKTTKKVPVTNCNSKQTVSCHKVTKKIPKKNCEAVETKVSVPVAEPVVSHPVVSHPTVYGGQHW